MPARQIPKLICKTNIKTEAQKNVLAAVLDQHPHINSWTIDQEDCDCVLRIFADSLQYAQLIPLIQQLGFEAREL